MRDEIVYDHGMRSLHSRHAFAALDKVIENHYIQSMTTETSMTDTVSSRLINDLHIAEVGFEAALNYKDYVAASWWRGEIDSLVGQLELALLMDDPATTMADVRFFEGFKYV